MIGLAWAAPEFRVVIWLKSWALATIKGIFRNFIPQTPIFLGVLTINFEDVAVEARSAAM
ncbi:hypothetical protein GCM10010924_23410 [Rhizobium wenxiniae]|nr:hypothetical protein GCM10010924_23410 [Rhizobium wenxiniae]